MNSKGIYKVTEPKESILDKSFKQEGTYLLTLKNGTKIAFYKRSEVWIDKAKCQFVTLTMAYPYPTTDIDKSSFLDYLNNREFLFTRRGRSSSSEIDIRYNDISCVWEW